MTKGIVIYDSWTGNTKKIAEVIASVTNFDISKVDDSPVNLTSYDIVVLGTPDIRDKPSEKISNYIGKVTPSRKFALFVTYGVPLWGQISSRACLKDMRRQLESKGSKFIGKFICPGYHVKYKTYKGRPSDKDLRKAGKFGRVKLIRG